MINLDSIRTLYRQPDTLALWGIPYDMRPGQSPRDLWNAPRPDVLARAGGRLGATMHAPGPLDDWIYLGCPGWWGSIEEADQKQITAWLARHAELVPKNPCEWSQVRRYHVFFEVIDRRIHFGWRMRGIRCTMLLSQLYWAGLQVRHGLGFLSERAVAAGAPGVWLVSKELQKSEWRWRLSNAQINYAATDALVMLPLFKWLGGLINAAGMLPTALAECNAVAAFVEFEYNGLTVNPAMLADHIELWRRGRELAIQPFRQRYPGVDPASLRTVAVALSLDNCYDGHRFYELDTARPRKRPLHLLGQQFTHFFKKQSDKYASSSDHSVAEAAARIWCGVMCSSKTTKITCVRGMQGGSATATVF